MPMHWTDAFAPVGPRQPAGQRRSVDPTLRPAGVQAHPGPGRAPTARPGAASSSPRRPWPAPAGLDLVWRRMPQRRLPAARVRRPRRRGRARGRCARLLTRGAPATALRFEDAGAGIAARGLSRRRPAGAGAVHHHHRPAAAARLAGRPVRRRGADRRGPHRPAARPRARRRAPTRARWSAPACGSAPRAIAAAIAGGRLPPSTPSATPPAPEPTAAPAAPRSPG